MSCRGQDVSFEVKFSAIETTVWWTLLAAASIVWFTHRYSKSKSMILYKFLFTVILLNAISDTIYLGWITAIANHHSARAAYYLYIFISKIALSSFVALMLTGAAGFCITRDDLGPHTPRVIGVPIVWLVTGWITGYIWYYSQGKPDDWCTMTVKEMNGWQSGVWFICSIINLATYLMAWIYIFSIMGDELEVLEATEKALAELRQANGQLPAAAPATATERVVKSLLLPEGNRSHLGEEAVVRTPPEIDVEAAQQLETFAGRIDFELKKKLLYRFALGCATYLTALICVLLLPLFSTTMLDTTLWALESVVKWVFIASLIYIFRPAVQNPYLSLDFEQDADLTTELAMMDEDDTLRRSPTPPGSSASPATLPKPYALSPVSEADTASGRDQGPVLPTSTQTTINAREEHRKKFSLGDEEEEEEPQLVEVKLHKSVDKST